MVLRIRPLLTQFPTNILYNQLNTPCIFYQVCDARGARYFLLTRNIGLNWCLRSNPLWLVELFTLEEATDFTGPTPQGSHYLPGLGIKVLLDFPTLTQFPIILICALVILAW